MGDRGCEGCVARERRRDDMVWQERGGEWQCTLVATLLHSYLRQPGVLEPPRC